MGFNLIHNKIRGLLNSKTLVNNYLLVDNFAVPFALNK